MLDYPARLSLANLPTPLTRIVRFPANVSPACLMTWKSGSSAMN